MVESTMASDEALPAHRPVVMKSPLNVDVVDKKSSCPSRDVVIYANRLIYQISPVQRFIESY